MLAGEGCVPPYYKVLLLGNFTSADGGDYTVDCADAYNENLREKASLKIPSLNTMLGTTLCTRFAEDDFTLISVSTAFKAENNYVSVMFHPLRELRLVQDGCLMYNAN